MDLPYAGPAPRGDPGRWRWHQHLVSACVFLVHLWLLIVGTPGLDFIKSGLYKQPEEREEAIEQMGDTLAQVAFSLATFNREWRVPLARKIGFPQRVFRIRQSWHLYRDGPSRIRRLEVWVDETLVYRTNDPDHDWRAPQLRFRRVRPMAESLVRKKKARNRWGLSRYLVQAAREDFPAAGKVQIAATRSRFPRGEVSVHHKIIARAPDWALEMPE